MRVVFIMDKNETKAVKEVVNEINDPIFGLNHVGIPNKKEVAKHGFKYFFSGMFGARNEDTKLSFDIPPALTQGICRIFIKNKMQIASMVTSMKSLVLLIIGLTQTMGADIDKLVRDIKSDKIESELPMRDK